MGIGDWGFSRCGHPRSAFPCFLLTALLALAASCASDPTPLGKEKQAIVAKYIRMVEEDFAAYRRRVDDLEAKRRRLKAQLQGLDAGRASPSTDRDEEVRQLIEGRIDIEGELQALERTRARIERMVETDREEDEALEAEWREVEKKYEKLLQDYDALTGLLDEAAGIGKREE